MRLYCLEQKQWLPRPIEEIFAFFSRAENLQTSTPPWLDFRMVQTPHNLETGALIRYRLHWHRLPIRWTTEITVWDPPHLFVDRQISGPYQLWNHEHSFATHENGTFMRDVVAYALPLGPIGRIAHTLMVKRDVENIFDFRAEKMRQVFPPQP